MPFLSFLGSVCMDKIHAFRESPEPSPGFPGFSWKNIPVFPRKPGISMLSWLFQAFQRQKKQGKAKKARVSRLFRGFRAFLGFFLARVDIIWCKRRSLKLSDVNDAVKFANVAEQHHNILIKNDC